MVFTVIVDPTGRAAEASRNLDYDYASRDDLRSGRQNPPLSFVLPSVWLRHLIEAHGGGQSLCLDPPRNGRGIPAGEEYLKKYSAWDKHHNKKLFEGKK